MTGNGFSGYVTIEMTAKQAMVAQRMLEWVDALIDAEDVREPKWAWEARLRLNWKFNAALARRAELDALQAERKQREAP